MSFFSRFLIALFSAAFLLSGTVFAEPTAVVVEAAKQIKHHSLKGRTEKSAASYAAGEPVVFVVELFGDGKPVANGQKIAWVRNGDDGVVEKGEADASAPVKIETTGKTPGFIRLKVDALYADGTPVKNGDRAVTFTLGAVCDAAKLTVATEPEDFDAFWDRQKERVKAVPMVEQERVPVKVGTPGVVCYNVTVTAPGRKPLTAYLSMPEDAKEKSLPATVVYFGYGVYPVGKSDGMARDRIVLAVNAHGFLNEQPREYYTELGRNELKGYAFNETENSNPETTYFNDMMLRLIRSLEYVKSLPEWNGEELVVTGHSQGGMQAGFAAGLDADVTKAILNQPWMCDIGGAAMGHLRGGWHIKPTAALKYYDTIYHMRRYNGEVELMAGLADYVCPPFGMAVIYEEAQGPKKIVYTQAAGHSGNPGGEKITQTAPAKQ